MAAELPLHHVARRTGEIRSKAVALPGDGGAVAGVVHQYRNGRPVERVEAYHTQAAVGRPSRILPHDGASVGQPHAAIHIDAALALRRAHPHRPQVLKRLPGRPGHPMRQRFQVAFGHVAAFADIVKPESVRARVGMGAGKSDVCGR